MGRYVIYVLVIFIALCILNWFKVINIPFLDLPDFTGDKQESIHKTEDTLEKMEQRVKYDLWYIYNWSLWLDVKIIFLTLFGGFSGKNAY